jgi:hypothetical protein
VPLAGLALALALTLPAIAAEDRVLEGRVIDAGGKPVAGARVTVGSRTTRTDAEGRFRLEALPADGVLEVGADRFLPTSLPLATLPEAVIEIRLEPAKRIEETVEVVAPEPAPGPAELPIRSVEVMAVAGSADNVFRTLHTLPGVSATEEFGSRLAVRGGGPDENLTVMDGVEIHNPYRLFGLTSAFNPETVSRFDLSSAAFSARHGDRLSSLLVVENRAGDEKARFRGSSALSITDANLVGEGTLPGGKGSWLVTARRTYYDLIANSIVGTDLPAFADVQGKLVLRAGGGRRLILQGLRSRESADSFFEGDRPGDEGALVSAARNDLVALAFEAPLGSRGLSRTVVSWYENTDSLDVDATFRAESRRSNTPDDDDAFGEAQVVFTRDLTVRDLALRQEATFPLGARQLLTAGLEVHDLTTGSAWNITGDRNPFAANGSSQQGGTGLPDVLDSSVSATRAGAFLEGTLERGALRLTPGLRLDWSGVNERTSLSPRLAAALRLSSRTTLRLGAGLFTQSPGYEKLIQSDYFLDLTGDAPLALESARASHLLLGLERDLGSGVLARVEGYWKEFDDLIVGRLETEQERRARVARYDFPLALQDSIPRAPQITSFPVNGSKGRAWGFDLYVSRPPAQGRRFSGWASYTFGKSDREAYGRLYPFEYDRPHALSTVVSWRAARRLEVAATLRVASGFPYTPVIGTRVFAEEDPTTGRLVPSRDATGLLVYELDLGDTTNLNSARLPTFARLDLRATFWPGGPSGRWQVYLDVINATNRANAGAIDTQLEYDPGADRPRLVFARSAALPLLPSIGVRFRF